MKEILLQVVTRDYEYIFSAASERERDTWLEVSCAYLVRRKS